MESYRNSTKFGDIFSTHNNNDSNLCKCVFILVLGDYPKT